MTARRRLAPEVEDRIVELTKQNQTATTIAEIVGVTTRTVTRVRSRQNANCEYWPHVMLTAEQITTAEHLLDDGASYTEVARTIGIGWDAVEMRWPGRSWTKKQCGQHRALLRRMRGVL